MTHDIDGFGPSDVQRLFGVSRETLDRIEAVLECLNVWRHKINLIGPAEWDHIWRRHIADSLRLWPHISTDCHIVDLGSGGGFPALPIACALTSEGSGHVTLVESIGKKANFLRTAAKQAGLRADVRQDRVEKCSDIEADIITARAFAPLPKLFDYAEAWFSTGAIGFFHKGQRWREELTAARAQWTFTAEAIPESGGGTGVILKVSEVSRARTFNANTCHRQSKGWGGKNNDKH